MSGWVEDMDGSVYWALGSDAGSAPVRSAVEGPLDALVEGSPPKKPRKLSRRDKELENLEY